MTTTHPTITCGRCQESAPVDRWQFTPISGPLPPEHYQCPNCREAFCRVQVPFTIHGRTGWKWEVRQIEARF